MGSISKSIKDSWFDERKPTVEAAQDVPGKTTDSGLLEVPLCKTTDLRNGEMKEFEIEGACVLLVKDKGEFAAIGGKCPHYGASLANGVYSNGKVRCPLHGACFSTESGDIEDFPGLDCVPKYQTKIVDDEVRFVAPRGLSNKRVRGMATVSSSARAPVVIVGGGPSGQICAESMRQEGYRGRILIISADRFLPYDRVQLTKRIRAKHEDIQLREWSFYEEHGIEIRLETSVGEVSTEEKFVKLRGSGEKIVYSKLVIAVGGRARKLEVPGSGLEGVRYIRNLEDNRNLAARAKHVVVIGASFVGLESAAMLAPEAQSVTVICNDSAPLRRTMGAIAGKTILELFKVNGVKIEVNASVVALEGKHGRVSKVVLADGRRLEVDLVIVGIGMVPNTEFLKGTGIQLDSRGFIPVNEKMEAVGVKDVFAIGDVCAFPLRWFTSSDKRVNVQHYQIAQRQGKTAGGVIAGKPQRIQTVPFFWTVLFKTGFRFTGFAETMDDCIVKEYDGGYNMYIFKDNHLVAVSSMGPKAQSVPFTEIFSKCIIVTKEEVKMNNTNDWSHLL